MSDPRIFLTDGKPCIGVRVSPSARKTEFKGRYGDRLRLSVSAPPVDDRANKEVEEVLAGLLGLGRGSVEILAGRTSRDKVVAFRRLTEAQLRARVGELLDRRISKERTVGREGS